MSPRQTEDKWVEPARRPATTPEARESYLASLAFDLAEKQLLDGTASAQVITQAMKLSSARERLEIERLQAENALLKAKTDSLASQARQEELYKQALAAMRSYSGQEDPADFDD